MSDTPKIPHCYFCSYLPPSDLSLKDKWHNSCAHMLSSHRNIMSNKTRKWCMIVLSEKIDRVEIKPVSKDPDKKPTEYGEENRANAKKQLSGRLEGITCYCPHCKRQHFTQVEEEFLELPNLWIIENKPAVLCGSCRH